jgi:hypothetical protein
MSFYPVPPSSQLVAQEQSLIGSTAPPCHGNWRRFQKACPVARYSASRTTGPTGRGMAGDAGSSGGDGIEMRVANKVTFKCVTWARDIRSPPSTTTPPPGLNDPPHTPINPPPPLFFWNVRRIQIGRAHFHASLGALVQKKYGERVSRFEAGGARFRRTSLFKAEIGKTSPRTLYLGRLLYHRVAKAQVLPLPEGGGEGGEVPPPSSSRKCLSSTPLFHTRRLWIKPTQFHIYLRVKRETRHPSL